MPTPDRSQAACGEGSLETWRYISTKTGISSPQKLRVLRISGDGSSKTWRYISTNQPIRLHTEKQPISERKSTVDIYIKEYENVAYNGKYEVGLFQAQALISKERQSKWNSEAALRGRPARFRALFRQVIPDCCPRQKNSPFRSISFGEACSFHRIHRQRSILLQGCRKWYRICIRCHIDYFLQKRCHLCH